MTVLYAVDGAVATVTLNRPERLNAWTAEMEQDYAAALDEATADGDVRAAVVTGAGPGYSAGWDMDELRTVSASSRAGSGGASVAVTATLGFPKPLIRQLQLNRHPLIRRCERESHALFELLHRIERVVR